MDRKRVTVADLKYKKERGEKITMLTAYDYPLASLIDQAGVDVILVGDSVANVVLGHNSTLPVTMDNMIYHAQAARRAVKYALLVGDMPFMSFNVSPQEAIRNAGRFLKELKRYAPEIYQTSKMAFEHAKKGDIIRVALDDMASIPENSIDYAVMEKSESVKILQMSWIRKRKKHIGDPMASHLEKTETYMQRLYGRVM